MLVTTKTIETRPGSEYGAGRYRLALRNLHWLVAICIIGLLTVGLIMTGLAHDNPLRGLLYSMHKSFGVTVLGLAFLRIGFRILYGAPPLPKIIPLAERFLAQCGHLALYFFMFAMPISGYVMSTSFGLPVKWFGIALPKLLTIDKARGQLAAEFHECAAYMLIALIILHVSAVGIYYWRQRINLLSRML